MNAKLICRCLTVPVGRGLGFKIGQRYEFKKPSHVGGHYCLRIGPRGVGVEPVVFATHFEIIP